jgi:hypothetical protein
MLVSIARHTPDDCGSVAEPPWEVEAMILPGPREPTLHERLADTRFAASACLALGVAVAVVAVVAVVAMRDRGRAWRGAAVAP